MKRINMKFFSFILVFLAVALLTSCVIQEGTKIEFTQLPAGVYIYDEDGGEIDLDEVKVKINNGETLALSEAITKYNLTVTGDKWSSVGEYSLVVVWNNAAISFKYSVVENIQNTNFDILWDGQGTSGDPWLIKNEADLRGLAVVVNGEVAKDGLTDTHCEGKYFELTADINLTPGWEPIGAGNRNQSMEKCHYFAGIFDGGNHTISGLTNVGYNPAKAAADYFASGGTVSISKGYAYGLFGVVFGATIKNLNMADVLIEDNSLVIDGSVYTFTLDSVGAIAGVLPQFATKKVSTFENCHVLSGTIKGYDATAGIVGRSYNSLTAKNCSNAASISCDRENAGKCGGITSICSEDNSVIEITNCSNTGKIEVKNAQFVGGIVGLINSYCSKVTESGNTNTGKLFCKKNGAYTELASNILGHYRKIDNQSYDNLENWIIC